MKHANHSRPGTFADGMINSLPATLAVAAIAICLGIFFIFSQNDNKPIGREEAVSYTGMFEKYKSRKNDCMICFEDGSRYSVYPHTESDEFRKTMTSLDKGTKLYILVNPNNDYVVEIKTDTGELLNFELSQEAIDSYDNGYIVLGYVVCAAGIFLIVYAVCSANYKRKEKARHAEKRARTKEGGGESPVLRNADFSVKSRILAEASAEGYAICYRRVKFVNELVINGKVYDEKKGIVEFEHKLCASLNGHSVEAGTDENCCSYIRFDGKVIESKQRWI